jgi:hypothetical protein
LLGRGVWATDPNGGRCVEASFSGPVVASKYAVEAVFPRFCAKYPTLARAGTPLALNQDVDLFVLEILFVFRACLTIVAVGVLSASLAQLRDAQGEGAATGNTRKIAWVRTVDGWEPSSVLTLGPPPSGPPALHPGLVATLQLGLSLLALMALPAAAKFSRPKS